MSQNWQLAAKALHKLCSGRPRLPSVLSAHSGTCAESQAESGSSESGLTSKLVSPSWLTCDTSQTNPVRHELVKASAHDQQYMNDLHVVTW